MSKHKNDIEYTSTPNAVVVTIKGNALRNLRKIAECMNHVRWCGAKNTDIGILENFVIGNELVWLSLNVDYSSQYHVGNVSEISQLIADGIDTDCELDTPQDKARKDELRTAFEKAGLY